MLGAEGGEQSVRTTWRFLDGEWLTLQNDIAQAFDPSRAWNGTGDFLKRGQLIDPAVGSVLGPAPLFKRAGRERSQLLLKVPAGDASRGRAVASVRRAVETAAGDSKLRGASFSVDVDPE